MKTTQNNNYKICGKCKENKDTELFPKLNPNSKSYNQFKNGIKPWCRECYKDYSKNYMKEKRNESGSKYDHYKKRYGISRENLNEMLKERNYKCDICGNESDHRYDKLCVDHSHTTGKVRGLLCFSCNVMIGQSKENIDVLKNAINYLKENN
jgi:hypothetical protein